MLGNEWNLLLRNLECDEQDVYNDSEQTSRDPPIIGITKGQLYDKMTRKNTHSQQFHPKADKYSCKEHLNIIHQYSKSPSPSQLSGTNNQESHDSTESVGINVKSDDNISLFSNLSFIHYVYVGHDLLTNDVTHVSVHSLAKVFDS